MINGKVVLIIGGCGYIGSSLYLYLKDTYKVDTVDLEFFGNDINPQNIKKNFAILKKSFLNKYNVIILLAGHSSVAMCEDNRISSFNNNVKNFVSLLENITTQKFIYASSSGVYGVKGRSFTEENDSYIPTNYYDLTKKTIDYYASLSAIEFYGLRFGTVNGGSPNLRTDLMINKMFLNAKKTKEITVYNSQILRPILGINDLCRAIEKIINTKDKRGIYNLASFNTSVKQIAEDVASYLGEVKVIDKGEKDIQKVYNFSISSSKFKKSFAFEFKDSVSTILLSLEQTYEQALKNERTKRIQI